ncbi:MAG: phenylalanine--tRNA ligase subunit beta [Thermoleophilia bacterium]|nr:phenylalanine--tRNA ligase subunit beta [Thermoleophilia bacterium]
MRLPLSWLREICDPPLTDDQLAERLSATGTAVERVERRGVPTADGNLDAFRVGRVLEAVRHPGADRLRVCTVDLGGDEPQQIVCGAPNVAAGQTVAVALPGAVMPGGQRLGVARLRGVESRGMILSETELELGQDGGGIMVLPGDLGPGTPLAQALPLAETVLELEITSNRPDCLAIQGLAREVHAITGAPLRALDVSLPPEDGPGRVEDHVALRVEAPDLCPRYLARVLVDVEVGPSPQWIRRRLEAAGMRSINNVVDVTNYVMLLTGQPLHAFDLDRLAGPEVVVRRARDGEPIVTLDGQERVMDASMLAICDAERPAVVAGIFGAEFAEVAEGTTRVLLEAATFDGPAVLRAAHALGLRTESSARFEKRLPPELPPRAMAVACRLVHELAGGRLVPGMLDEHTPLPAAAPVRVRHARVDALLGVHVPAGESAEILVRLGFGVRPGDDHHDVEVPFERAGDVTREADLIEEIGRVWGIERIPAVLPKVPAAARRTPAQALTHRITERAADLGLAEHVGYRFVPEADADRLGLAADDPRRQVVRLANALSDEMAVMRRSLVPGLLRAVGRNQARQRTEGGLFEVGRTYLPQPDGLADEPRELCAVLFGPTGGAHWRVPARPVDLWTATGVAGAIGRAAGVRVEALPGPAEPYLHPARQAWLVVGDRRVGWAGEVHPLTLRAFDVKGPVAALSVDLAALLAAAPAGPRAYEDLVSVPVSTRDLAMVLGEDRTAAEVLGVVREAGAPLVREARVFDRYAGDQVAEGRVSLAVRLGIVDPGRTLTDEEIDAAVAAVVAALRDRLGAELRG